MPETTAPKWSDGVSLEGVPYEDQPKVIVTVRCYRKSDSYPHNSVPMRATQHDITDWLQAHPGEQIIILDQLVDALNGSDDLDTLGNLDILNDETSGDHLVGLKGPGLPAGADGTDIHLLSAYARYLKECRDRNFIPFSDEKGHGERLQAAREQTLVNAREEILSAVDRYTQLARETAAAGNRRPLFSDEDAEQNKQLQDRTRSLVGAS